MTQFKEAQMHKSYGVTNLQHPLAERIIQRSLYNCMLPGDPATYVNYQVSWDAAVSKQGPREYRKWVLVLLSLRCWGEVPESDGWGMHAIYQAMRDSHSPDLCTVLRAYLGNDHREDVEREVLMVLQRMLATKMITIEHMLLLLPPILFNESFDVEKRLPKMDDRWMAVENVPVHTRGSIGVDLAAMMELAGLSYDGNSQASPFNEDIYEHRGSA